MKEQGLGERQVGEGLSNNGQPMSENRHMSGSQGQGLASDLPVTRYTPFL